VKEDKKMKDLTVEQRIKRQIMNDSGAGVPGSEPGDIDAGWDALAADGSHWDVMEEFRQSGERTGLPADTFSRHYESEEVGRKLDDGTWVGWTYWHGGGKHGEPEMIPWMDSAYLLDVTEEEKVVTVRTFSKA
jgi:hypothetical protein